MLIRWFNIGKQNLNDSVLPACLPSVICPISTLGIKNNFFCNRVSFYDVRFEKNQECPNC